MALAALADRGERFDVIYLDPPYDSDLYLRACPLGRGPPRSRRACAVAEHFHKSPLPETIGRLARRRSLRIGDHVLSIYGATREESSPS